MVKIMPASAVQADTRENILDAIERLLARFGYQKTTMDDLAREAGIGKGTIYLYFPSKEEVALCSIDRVVQRVQQELQTIAASGGPAADRLREMLVQRVLIRVDSVQAYSQSLDDLFESLRPAYMARRSRYFAAETAIFAGVLTEGRREKEFSFSDPEATAHTLLLATNSLLPYSLSVRELGKRAEIARNIERLADLLLNGLLRREASRTH
jgi:AcrR family transcriptional regulator